MPAQPETPEHPYAASIRKLSGMLGVDPEPLYAIRSRNNWAEHVIGGYARQDCPAEPIVGRCSLEMRRRAVALALSRFAADGDEYSNPYFRKYVEAALRDVAAPEPGANGNGRVGGHHAGNGHGAASVSLADLKALVRAGGDMLRLDAGRRVVLPRLQRECAELWARAGPAFERLDFRELVPVIANDFALTQALRGQLERLDYRAA